MSADRIQRKLGWGEPELGISEKGTVNSQETIWA